MPTASLPENPSLDHLKAQAKLVRDLIRAGDAGGLSMIDEFHPRLGADQLTNEQRARFKTTDAQLIIARMYGFAGWPRLRAHLEVIGNHSFTPSAEHERSEQRSFVENACLDYAEDGPSPQDRIAEAHRMLAADPTLATGSVDALATVGDHGALTKLLASAPQLVNEPCGPNGWPPLLYATYSRIRTDRSDWSAVETTRVLLSLGADANAGFLWRGLVPPFTALTGALGRGERHQPIPPQRLDIARLLLEAGADPNDGQALYNNGIGGQNHDDPAHLQLLVEFGLGIDQNGPWYQRLGDQLRQPAELLYDELEAACKRNRPAVLAYLVGLDLDLDRPVGRAGATPVRIASSQGHQRILDILAAAGIDTTPTPTEQALALTRSNDVAGLRLLLDTQPGLLDDLRRDNPGLINNIGATHGSMLRLLLELGFDINDRTDTKTALHHAAEANDRERAELLIEHGADPNLTDTHIGATPWGWANHFHHDETAGYLRALTHDGDDALPEISISCLDQTRTLASPALVDRRLDDIHRRGEPVLVTIRADRAALTIGLGHPTSSVALYLDADGTPWHATTSESAPTDGPAFRDQQTDRRFTSYLPVATARAMAAAFVRWPDRRPSANWIREG